MPLLVLFAILFPAIHSYEHIHQHTSSHKKTLVYHKDKTLLKAHSHSDECSICHFKFSPVTPFVFSSFEFYKSISISSNADFYSEALTTFFKGSLFALRAPPSI